MPLIDLIVSQTFLTSEGRTPQTGVNTAAFLSPDATADAQGVLCRTPEQVDGLVTDNDITAQAGAQIKALLAQGGGVGGVYILRYDASASPTPETPADALTAGVALGILPLWSYTIIVCQDRTEAAIASAATWADTNARDRALVAGQIDTSSILSGTVPATIAASPGADLVVCLYDDQDTSANIERVVGRILANNARSQRAGWASIRPLGMVAYATELTDAQVLAASGRESGQARCLVHGPLYPADAARSVIQGYTVGGTLAEVEWGVICVNARWLAAIARFSAQRSDLNLPVRTDAASAQAIQTVYDTEGAALAAAGYFEAGVAADPTIGRPALPDGFTVSVSFDGQDAVVDGWAAYPGDVRRINQTLRGVVT